MFQERNGSSDTKLASLMAHEDADMNWKSSGRLGVKEAMLKVKPVSKKKRTQPEYILPGVESKPSLPLVQSSLPSKHSNISNSIANTIASPQWNKLKPQDIDEDYDNI